MESAVAWAIWRRRRRLVLGSDGDRWRGSWSWGPKHGDMWSWS
jgi:hypothetical protein